MNKNTAFFQPSISVKQVLLVVLFIESLAITVAITKAAVLGISPKTYFGEVDRGGFITYISCLQLLVAGVMAMIISKVAKSAQQLRNSRWFWLVIALGLWFLTLDDLLGIHEYLDYLLHELFQFEETEISDLADDLIVGGYLVVFLIYVISQWQSIKIFHSSFNWFKLGFVLTAVMVVLDMASNNTLFVSMVTDDNALASNLQEWLGVIEDSIKIFAEGMFIVGIYKCWQIAKRLSNDH
ncbi:MAG: hypothetical protein AAF383_07270 [Cyanobacteria bacterium P01_A01_bin.83]